MNIPEVKEYQDYIRRLDKCKDSTLQKYFTKEIERLRSLIYQKINKELEKHKNDKPN
jgi:hypothetical protein